MTYDLFRDNQIGEKGAKDLDELGLSKMTSLSSLVLNLL